MDSLEPLPGRERLAGERDLELLRGEFKSHRYRRKSSARLPSPSLSLSTTDLRVSSKCTVPFPVPLEGSWSRIQFWGLGDGKQQGNKRQRPYFLVFLIFFSDVSVLYVSSLSWSCTDNAASGSHSQPRFRGCSVLSVDEDRVSSEMPQP